MNIIKQVDEFCMFNVNIMAVEGAATLQVLANKEKKRKKRR